MERKKFTAAVEVPMSRMPTEFCTASTMTCIVRPMPTPTNARTSDISSQPESVMASRAGRAIPPSSPVPMIGYMR